MTDNEIFKTEIKCINRRANGKCNGGTDCCKCDLLMNEKDIISAYERAIANDDLINRLQAEIDQLKLVLIGVMHFVDKWLDGAELEQDEVNRASAMREKTLQIVEKQQAEIERLNNLKSFEKFICERIHTDKERNITWDFATKEAEQEAFEQELEKLFDISTARAEAIKEFAERLKEKLELCDTVVGSDDFGVTIEVGYEMEDVNETIDNLVKEMVGED